MKTSVERVDDTTVKLSITLEAAELDAAVDEAARRLAGEVKIPGFRPGKAPRKVLERRLGKDALLEEAVRGSLPGYYTRAVEQEELPVVSGPEFDVEGIQLGQDSTFTATVQVRPEIDVPDYAGVQVAYPDWELTDEDVQEQLDGLRQRFATLETIDRGADVGSYVRMTVTGQIDGERVEDASGEDLLYEVRDPSETDSALDRSLIGTEAGGIVKFTDTLGDDYEDRAGQEVDFTVIVKEVKVRRLPELDDDFASDASEFDTMEELEQELRTQLAAAKRSSAAAGLRGKVVEAVADLVEVPLPEALVQEELRFSLQQVSHEAQRLGISPEQYLQGIGQSADEFFQRLEENARRTVKAQLVVDAIGRAAGIEVDRDDLGVEIMRQARRLDQDPQELADYMTHPDRIGALAGDAFRRKTIDHLIGSVQVLGGPPDEPEPEAAEPEAAGPEAGTSEVQPEPEAAEPEAEADAER